MLGHALLLLYVVLVLAFDAHMLNDPRVYFKVEPRCLPSVLSLLGGQARVSHDLLSCDKLELGGACLSDAFEVPLVRGHADLRDEVECLVLELNFLAKDELLFIA